MSKLITTLAVFAASVTIAQSPVAIAQTFGDAITSEFSAAKNSNAPRHANATKTRHAAGARNRHAGTAKTKHAGVKKSKHTSTAKQNQASGKQNHANTAKQTPAGTSLVNNKKHTQVPNKPLSQGPNTKQVNKLKPGPKAKGVAIVDKWNGWRPPKTIVVVRDRPRLWIGDGWRTFPLYTAIGVWTFAGAALIADGYVNVASNACYGRTEDGCRLRWQELTLAEGGSDYQCVKFCKTRTAGGPVQLAEDDDQTTGSTSPSGTTSASMSTGAGGVTAASADGACDLTIYELPEFKGLSAANQEDRPTLDEEGWKNEISSVEIRSGTWDFFTEDNYRGETMRLKPGRYTALNAVFSQRIGSLMCNRTVASR